MRILRLDLLAFGPFTGGRLDFAKKPGALQLIYGPNEAGKSTTLRALIALLYGIPLRTADAHQHDMTRLRVGALLQNHRGRTLSLTRRKGAKHTLLDEHGEPTTDAALSELLLGIDESMFRQMFGLDHERLREGGEALLAGGGNLGEGLFDASVGTRALRALKEALKTEAEALYKVRGKTPKLNLALDSWREKVRQKREAALSPQAFAEQTRALATARARREQCLSERRRVLTERARLERDLRLLPVLARHAQLSVELQRLNEPKAGEPRLGLGSESCSRAEPRASTSLAEEPLRDLERRYGATLAAEAELPRSQAERVALEREIEALRARLGAAAAVDQAVDTPLRTRWRKLGDAHSAGARRLAELGQERLLQSAEEAQLEQQLRELPDGEGAPGLAELVARIEREDVIAARARSELELSRRATLVARGLVSLRVSWAKPLSALTCCERLAALRFPEERELLELEQREAELEREAARAAEQQRELAAREKALRQRLGELLAEGPLSSAAELAAARTKRDAVLRELAREPARLAECRLEVERVDALADKLLVEASRSAEVSRLTREQAEVEADGQALASKLSTALARARALTEALAQHLAETGLEHDSLRALRPKLAKLLALRDGAGEVLEQRLSSRALGAREQELAQQLARQLGEPIAGTDAALETLLVEAQARLHARTTRDEQRAVLSARRDELAARGAATAQQIAQLERQQSEALARLETELAARGFPPELGHDEVLACLDDLQLLGDRERRRAALLERLAGASAQRDALVADASALVARLLPELAAEPLGEQLAALGQLARSERESQRDGARLRQELAEVERELVELGDGAELGALCARVRGLEPLALRAQRIEIDSQLASLEEEVGALDQSIGGLEVGLSRVTEAAHAVPIAEEVEAELANVRALTRRYLEVRLSQSLLAREVERHRAAHQGPLVTRASALFSSLTLRRYTGLSVELDERDEPLLCAASAAGKLVRVAGLSDGTRDQLYLALRIASLERFLATSPALPLVLDDAFIHFDDARAEVALCVLAELAKKTQVLFFTHHARMVEIAKRALKPSQVALHELDPVRGTVAFRDNGPLFADA